MGFTGKIDYLTGPEAREQDPAVGASVSSAVLTSLDRHVNPESLLCGLHTRIDEMGVLVRENTSAQKLTRSGSSWSVETAEDNLCADNVVVAMGAATNTVLRPLGITLPIVGIPGESTTFSALAHYVPECDTAWLHVHEDPASEPTVLCVHSIDELLNSAATEHQQYLQMPTHDSTRTLLGLRLTT